MEKMNINDQGGVFEYKMNSQNEVIFADKIIAQEEEKNENVNNNKDDGDKKKIMISMTMKKGLWILTTPMWTLMNYNL